MDILLIFYEKPKNASKELAIQLAKECECIIEKDRYKVLFHENDRMFKKLLSICGNYATTELFIDNKEYSPKFVSDIFNCYNKGQCTGICSLIVKEGIFDYNLLLHHIKMLMDHSFHSYYDENLWKIISQEFENLNFVKKIDENTFQIDKEAFKNKIIEDTELPLKICQFANQQKIIKQIDFIPEKIQPKPKQDEKLLSKIEITDPQKNVGLAKYQKEKYQEIAEIMAPIFAREIMKELTQLIQQVIEASEKEQK